MVGVPARQIGWMDMSGERLDVPLVGEAEALCSSNGRYVLRGNKLSFYKTE